MSLKFIQMADPQFGMFASISQLSEEDARSRSREGMNLRYVDDEFKHYGYSDLLRNVVGSSKISISAILLVGIWYNDVVFYGALSMAFFMICAQYSHFKVQNPVIKFLPSLIFLIMSLFVAAFNYGMI